MPLFITPDYGKQEQCPDYSAGSHRVNLISW